VYCDQNAGQHYAIEVSNTAFLCNAMQAAYIYHSKQFASLCLIPVKYSCKAVDSREVGSASFSFILSVSENLQIKTYSHNCTVCILRNVTETDV